MKKFLFAIFGAATLALTACGGGGTADEAAKAEPAAQPAGEPVALPEGHFGIHYYRPDGAYEGWGLHLWGAAVAKPTAWTKPFPFTGFDDFGAYAHFPMHAKGEGKPVNYIIHKGDKKDQKGKDMLFDTKLGKEIWVISGSTEIYYSKDEAKAAAGM